MRALFGFIIVAFSVLGFQKMTNQEFVQAQTGEPTRNRFEEFCPSEGISCVPLKEVVVVAPKK